MVSRSIVCAAAHGLAASPGPAAALALVLGLGAAPVAALTPSQVCSFDPARLVFLAEEARPEGQATWPVWDVTPLGDGLVYATPDGGYRPGEAGVFLLLQHCPTGREVALRLPNDENAHVADNAVQAMIFGPEPFTLRQIAGQVERMGGWARLSTGRIGPCACRAAYGRADG